MEKNNSSKGRGISDLILENTIDVIREGEVVNDVKLSEIRPNPYQPRKFFNQEKIDELAQSIKENGVFQPIILKKGPNGYIIVSGERRYRASAQIGLETIPAIIRGYDEGKVAEIALIENLQREDLTSVEEAEAYRNIMGYLGLTQNELAIKVGKSRSYITNMLGLLTLPPEVLEMISKGDISAGHARALSKLENQDRIILLAKRIIEKGLSVRDIEQIAKGEAKLNEIKRVKKPKYDKIAKTLSKKYGADVKIDDKKITIKSGNVEELIKVLLGEKNV